jgi:sulfatase modifying factor 1
LQFSERYGNHRRRSKIMVRKALAGALAALLAQLTFGPGVEQIAAGHARGSRSDREDPFAHGSATAEALARIAPASNTAIAAEPGHDSLEPTPVPLAQTSLCPEDMVLVEGQYCTDVLEHCLRWLDDETLPFARCAQYQAPSRCIGTRIKERFCIDRFEYTSPGESLPLNYASFQRANSVCQALGKRVCTESEWNFACEGEEMRPYPYGFARQAKCNQDRDDLYEANPHRQILADRREPARARPECVSPFGVFNMTGNMDEPVLREGSAHIDPFRNALKGGWWMPARNRCRPATTAHDDYYQDIQVGVRCCSGPASNRE